MTQNLINVLKNWSECFNMKLSQKFSSDYPYRKNGFFMSEICLNSQIKQNPSINAPLILIQQDKTIISQVFNLVLYDGVTLQNTAYSLICGAVATKTESEPHHPMFIHTVQTQNLVGAYHMLKSYLINIISFIVFIVGVVLFNFAVLFSMALILSLGA